ncbi:MAG: hypothetical protein JXQ90_03940 [Cyclobacteriaceae bacterium]
MKGMFGLLLIMLTMVTGTMAQEGEFSDEDLSKYATVMKWAEAEKAVLQSVVKDSVGFWLDESDVLSTSQYNMLSKAKKANTMETAEASEEEKAIFEEIQQRIEDKKSAYKEAYTTRIKDDIGAGLYNKLRKALKADAELKTRYQAIFDELGAEDEESTSSSEG